MSSIKHNPVTSLIPPFGRGEAILIECPRDAMQGWPHFIPTQKKIEYLNELLKVGFNTIDFGSFVNPKAIPQMADTAEVIKGLQLENTTSKLLAIVANERGAADAANFEQITYLGFPFSISETFQQRNANSTIDESLKRVEKIKSICDNHKKELVVYISMGFGNPYGDMYNAEIVIERTKQIQDVGVKIISVADTVGLATANDIKKLMHTLLPIFANIEIGVHLHSTPNDRNEKLEAALEAGCKRFDAAIKGIGGCPMAGNELVGNMDTEELINYFEAKNIALNLDKNSLIKSSAMANEIFL